MRRRQPRHSDDPRLGVAIEDRFIIIRMWEPRALLPHLDIMERLASCLASLEPTYSVLLDFRHLPEAADDVVDALRPLLSFGATVLATRREDELLNRLQHRLGTKVSSLLVSGGALPLRYSYFDLRYFQDYDGRMVSEVTEELVFDEEADVGSSSDAEEYPPLETQLEEEARRRAAASFLIEQEDTTFVKQAEYIDLEYDDDESFMPPADSLLRIYDLPAQLARMEWFAPPDAAGALFEAKRTDLEIAKLQRFIRVRGRNSLLSEFSIQMAKGQLLVTPYHRHAFNEIQGGDQILLGQPAVLASRTSSLLMPEVRELEELLNEARITEARVQAYLEQHPALFNSLGYSDVYPQVVLERDDGTSLRPDFMVRPAGEQWWDILELKTPRLGLVGRRDRKTLPKAIHDLAAQLREYAAAFEDERLAERVEAAYGIKCYRPRLIGVIGRTQPAIDERQARRAMTQYADVSLVSFDRLLDLARTRLLI